MGARATALGQAAMADGGSSEAVFWNPAGLATLTRGEFAIHHYDAFFGTGDAVVIAVPSSRLGTFAFTAYLVDYGDEPVTGEQGNQPIGQISPRNLALMASYATELPGGIAIGVTYKLAQLSVSCSGDCAGSETATGTTTAVDVGLQYDATWVPVVFGVSLRNFGFPLQTQNQAQEDRLPTRVAAGIAVTVVRPPPGVEGIDVRVLADVQGTVGEGSSLDPVKLLGVEAGVAQVVRLRTGYAFLNSNARGPSLGFGVRFGNVAFDLGTEFSSAATLGDQQPVQISFRAIF